MRRANIATLVNRSRLSFQKLCKNVSNEEAGEPKQKEVELKKELQHAHG